jgi:hypothetical protein
MMVAVVGAVSMADGLMRVATVPTQAEVATYLVPATDLRTSAPATLGAPQAVT